MTTKASSRFQGSEAQTDTLWESFTGSEAKISRTFSQPNVPMYRRTKYLAKEIYVMKRQTFSGIFLLVPFRALGCPDQDGVGENDEEKKVGYGPGPELCNGSGVKLVKLLFETKLAHATAFFVISKMDDRFTDAVFTSPAVVKDMIQA